MNHIAEVTIFIKIPAIICPMQVQKKKKNPTRIIYLFNAELQPYFSTAQ